MKTIILLLILFLSSLSAEEATAKNSFRIGGMFVLAKEGDSRGINASWKIKSNWQVGISYLASIHSNGYDSAFGFFKTKVMIDDEYQIKRLKFESTNRKSSQTMVNLDYFLFSTNFYASIFVGIENFQYKSNLIHIGLVDDASAMYGQRNVGNYLESYQYKLKNNLVYGLGAGYQRDIFNLFYIRVGLNSFQSDPLPYNHVTVNGMYYDRKPISFMDYTYRVNTIPLDAKFRSQSMLYISIGVVF